MKSISLMKNKKLGISKIEDNSKTKYKAIGNNLEEIESFLKHPKYNSKPKLLKKFVNIILTCNFLVIIERIYSYYKNFNFVKHINNSIFIKYKNDSSNSNLLRFAYITNFSIPEDENNICKKYNGLEYFRQMLSVNTTFTLCEGEDSYNVCYDSYFRGKIVKRGVLVCKIKNAFLDPLKWEEEKYPYIYNRSPNQKGNPILKYGAFIMKCNKTNKATIIRDSILNEFYLNSWKYCLDNQYKENFTELAPNKTIFLIVRDKDSSNLYHASVGLLNAISIMKIMNLSPENIQVLFLDSLLFPEDPILDLYKELISRGGEVLYIKQLNKIGQKFKLNKAVFIPSLHYSPFDFSLGLFYCKYITPGYLYLKHLIAKYMNIKVFKDDLSYSENVIRYSKIIKNPEDSKYTKFVTIQWRKPYPSHRTNQERLMGNGPFLLEILQKKVPDNVLVRLVDTGNLTIKEQISLGYKTDYLIGIHGAGIALSIFLPKNTIIHEIRNKRYNDYPLTMAFLSGHKIIVDKIKAYNNKNNKNILNFCPKDFYKKIIKSMKKIKFIN